MFRSAREPRIPATFRFQTLIPVTTENETVNDYKTPRIYQSHRAEAIFCMEAGKGVRTFLES